MTFCREEWKEYRREEAMKKEDKTVIREMVKHKNLETNIPAYGGAYINAVYEYSLFFMVIG